MSSRVLPIAYFGEEGSFSQVAAQRRFPRKALRSCPAVDGAFAALTSGEVKRIVVPIENASAGIITETVDRLIEVATTAQGGVLPYGVQECLAMKITYALLTRPGAGRFGKIYSHFAPLGHCRDWLQQHYPGVALVPVASTAEAARRARQEKGAAALAGEQAAALYGLQVIALNVSGEVPNRTQFFVVGKPEGRRVKATRTSLVIELPHARGSLVRALTVLAKGQLSLTRIQSRPIPGRFDEYRFFIECEGGMDQPGVASTLKRLAIRTDFLAVVGSYPVRNV